MPGTPGPKPLLRGWIHVCAFVCTLVAGPLLVTSARNGAQRAALIIYVASLLALFGVSSLFHRVNWSPGSRRAMRRADHSTIFLAIAGSYTAVSAVALHGWQRGFILGVSWGGATLGILLRQIWLDAPKPVVAIPYVLVGWSALGVLPALAREMGPAGTFLLLSGGIAYTVGALVYSTKRPNPFPRTFGYHEIFHACTVIGAALQFAAIAAFAIPRS